MAQLINCFAGNPTPLAFAAAREWDRSGRRFGATAKARDRLQFTAGTPLDEGLQRTIEWTRTNRATIRRCMLQHASLMPELRTAYR